MRVLIFSQYFWPESFHINGITLSLAKKNIEVEVLTGKPNYPEGRIFEGYRAWGCLREKYESINVYRIPLIGRASGGLRLALNYFCFIVCGLLFAPWLLRKKQYDVIFIYAPSPILSAIPAIFIGWLKNVPVVLWVQDLWPESLSATGYVKNKFVHKVIEHIVRFIYRHVDLLLVQSEAFIAPVEKLASGTPIKYYPNSVDGSFAIPTSDAVPDIAGLGQGFSVMFAGNIGAAQAVEVIVEAATLLKDYSDIQFVVLGDGSRRKWMIQEAKKRGLVNLHLPGRFPVETMPGFMQKASALLVSLTDRKVFAMTVPNKVQAYMAAGRPILACLNGEGARLVTVAKAGLAVPAQDGKALAQAIIQLYEMTPDERDVMGAKGRAYYKQHFDHDQLVEKLIEYLPSVFAKEKKTQ